VGNERSPPVQSVDTTKPKRGLSRSKEADVKEKKLTPEETERRLGLLADAQVHKAMGPTSAGKSTARERPDADTLYRAFEGLGPEKGGELIAEFNKRQGADTSGRAFDKRTPFDNLKDRMQPWEQTALDQTIKSGKRGDYEVARTQDRTRQINADSDLAHRALDSVRPNVDQLVSVLRRNPNLQELNAQYLSKHKQTLHDAINGKVLMSDADKAMLLGLLGPRP
jgi:hypothetical protein